MESSSLFTWDSVYTIDQESIDIKTLETKLSKKNTDFPIQLNCYNINYKELSRFLHDYKYAELDEVDIIVKNGGSKNKKKNKYKTKKRKINIKQKKEK